MVKDNARGQLTNAYNGRWIVAPTSGRAHLDLGERSSQSLRINAEHVIVTACHAHIDATATVVPETHTLRCSNCVRIARSGVPIKPRAAALKQSGRNAA